MSEGGGIGRRAGLRNISLQLRKSLSLNTFPNVVNHLQTLCSFLLYPILSAYFPVFPQKWTHFDHIPVFNVFAICETTVHLSPLVTSLKFLYKGTQPNRNLYKITYTLNVTIPFHIDLLCHTTNS